MSYTRNLKSLALATSALSLIGGMALADQLILDDLIVDGSICAGFDCINGESFGFDTLRLKENNLRIKFIDTSNSASFPTNDWQITANDSANGGANKFSIDDIDGGRTPFTIEASAPSHSLYVDDGGRIGLGTSTPVVEMHIVNGDSPTVRLEQNGASGFTPQTWDLAGNETNFFVRDATNGSKLPFRIRPDAPSNSIYVDTDGDVGFGTASPAAGLDIASDDSEAFYIHGAGSQIMRLKSDDGQPVQFRLQSDSVSNRRIIATLNDGTTQKSQISLNDTSIFLAGPTVAGTDLWATIDAGGIDLAGGTIRVNVATTAQTLNVPDYVFDTDYDLMPLNELSKFVALNHHLPNVPSAVDINAVGLDMTTMQLTLLEKVEELTLYTLAQQETIEELQQQVALQRVD